MIILIFIWNVNIVYSEIQYCNNHKAARTKALYQFNFVKYKIGATATPITNNPGNLFGIFNFIDEKLFSNWKLFSNSYLRFVGYKRPPVPKNMEALKEKVKPYLMIKTKEEISDQLPSLLINKIYCDMPDSIAEMSAKIFEEIEVIDKQVKSIENKLNNDIKAMEGHKLLNQLKSASMDLQTISRELIDDPRLLQLSTSKRAMQFYVNETSSKLIQCLELVDSILDSGEKVCIFTKFERMQQILEEEINKQFKSIKIAKINGSLSSQQRYIEAYDKFREQEEYKILLGTDAMAEGINLNRCRYLIEYDLADSHSTQTQRHGRLERADSIHETVIVYQLIMNDSFDTIIQEKVVSKKERYKDLKCEESAE